MYDPLETAQLLRGEFERFIPSRMSGSGCGAMTSRPSEVYFSVLVGDIAVGWEVVEKEARFIMCPKGY